MGVHLVCLLCYFLNCLCRSILTPSVNTRSTSSASSNFFCWKIKLNSGSLRILTNSSLLIGSKKTRMGSLPNSSGIRSYIFAIEKDPLAMKRMWSVLTSPNFVVTVVPSINGSKSLCTPSVETPFPVTLKGPSGTANLSI